MKDGISAHELQHKNYVQEIAALQTAVTVHERQAANAVASQAVTADQLASSQADLAAGKQHLAEQQSALTEQQALRLSMQQSIEALQAQVASRALAVTTSDSRFQAVTDQLEMVHEQLQHEKQKLRAALHNAAAAQEAALRLQAHLSEQKAEAADQQQQFNQAVHADSFNAEQLQANVLAMQDKIHVADQAIAAHRQQTCAQQAKADTAEEQMQAMVQQLATQTEAVESLQTALKTAGTSTDSNACLISSLQEAARDQEATAAIIIKSLQTQLKQQTAQNAYLSTEVEDLNSKLTIADQAIASLKGDVSVFGGMDSRDNDGVACNSSPGPVFHDSTNTAELSGNMHTVKTKALKTGSEVSLPACLSLKNHCAKAVSAVSTVGSSAITAFLFATTWMLTLICR